ncbi:hypothetical protein RIF29_19030 [Crotalaria pallida]|uniref:ZF-HD dimerization-type domain-containing protein n=1 Tax=Crotalaria pallida TaxID=3830 RepID=A0AAN9F194_CROPI
MDIITTTGTCTPAKSPEPESETPTRIQQPINNNAAVTVKPISFSNGVLKRHPPHGHHHNHHHHHHHHQVISPTATVAAATTTAVAYKECLKNHAASLGGHAVDGCGEFMPSPNATAGDPASIKCAACGCHRNFHRREPEDPPIPTTTHVIEYQPHHRHHPPPPPLPPFQPPPSRSPNSASPPPISSSYYPSAPHMLIALSSGAGLSVPPESTAAPANHPSGIGAISAASPRKRFRTKFSQEQKEKMHEFAERVGWKMQKRDEDLVMEFCNEVGVDRGVLKVWMHNNKNTFGKKDASTNNNNAIVAPNGVVLGSGSGGGNNNVLVLEQGHNGNNNGAKESGDRYEENNDDSGGGGGGNVGSGTNGSSSSS